MAQGVGSGLCTRTADVDALLSRVQTPFPSGFVLKRALGSGEGSTSSTSTSRGLLTNETLFPSSTPPSSTPPTGPEERHDISQIALEWIFAVVGLAILGVVIVWRCTCAKYRTRNVLPFSYSSARRRATPYRNRPYSLRQPPAAHIHDSGDPFDSSTGPLVLSPSFLHTGLMPLVDGRGVQINSPTDGDRPVRGRRVTGLDVDEGGRRRGGGCSEDDDEDCGVEDELPAYEVGKRPPGYHVAIGNTARPDIVEVGLPEPVFQHMRESQVALSRGDRQISEHTASSQNTLAHGRVLQSSSHDSSQVPPP